MAIIISYPTSASRIIVSLKKPQDETDLPDFFCKQKTGCYNKQIISGLTHFMTSHVYQKSNPALACVTGAKRGGRRGRRKARKRGKGKECLL